MKFREIFHFEFTYQLRRVSAWLLFAVLLVFTILPFTGIFIGTARRGGYFLNSPFVIAFVTVISGLLGFLVAAVLAGKIAARDVRTRMHPLTYTAPVGKAEYLGGRFLAAFVLNAAVLLAVPAGFLLRVQLVGVDAALLGPFRPVAYLSAYFLLALPNAFIATALLFSLAALSRRALASYLGSVLLFVVVAGAPVIADLFGLPELRKLVDPLGISIISEFGNAWTPIEKSTFLIGLEGSLLWNRLLWLGIALGALAFTHFRFRFAHHTASTWWNRITRRRDTHAPTPGGTAIAGNAPITVPQVRQTFGFATSVRQTLTVAWKSFREVMTRRGGLALAALYPMFLILLGPELMELMGVPLLPRTEHIITYLTPSLANLQARFDAPPLNFLLMTIPLLTVFYAGELVWRERDAGLNEITDAAPAPEWVLFLGKFLGFGLVLVAWLSLLMTAGIVTQMRMGYYDFEIGLYLLTLFGLQLADYLLFALLALGVHVLVDRKHVGHLVLFIAYVFIAFASALGVEHNLLVYGADPGRSYTQMRGFGASPADHPRSLSGASGGHAGFATVPAARSFRGEYLVAARDGASDGGAGRSRHLAGDARRAGTEGSDRHRGCRD